MIEWEPMASVEVLYVAFPLLTFPAPNVVVPSLNVTVPAAVVEETVAVNVTDTPRADGFNDDDNVVVVFALFTVCEMTDEVLLLQFVSPG